MLIPFRKKYCQHQGLGGANLPRKLRLSLYCLHDVFAGKAISSAILRYQMATVRISIVLCFVQFLMFLLLLLYYVTREFGIVHRITEENPVISAVRDIMTSADRNLSDCRLLFGTGSSAHNFSMTDDFQNNIAEFLSAVRSKRAGREDGHTYNVMFEYRLFHYLTWKLKFVHTVCETGRPTAEFVCTL